MTEPKIVWGRSLAPIHIDPAVPALGPYSSNAVVPGAAITLTNGVYRVTFPAGTAKGNGVTFRINIAPPEPDLTELIALADARAVRFTYKQRINAGVAGMGIRAAANRGDAGATAGYSPLLPPTPLAVTTDFVTVSGSNTPVTVALVQAWLDGPTPGLEISVIMHEYSFSGPAAHEAVDVEFTDFALEVMEVEGGAAGPAAVRYRDPADGKFKPLSLLAVRGYPIPPATMPDPGHQAIVWATDPRHSKTSLIDVDWAQASIVNGPDVYGPTWMGTPPANPTRVPVPWPAEANLRVTPMADGVKVQWDAFSLREIAWKIEQGVVYDPALATWVTGNQDFPVARVKVPVALSPKAPHFTDGRLLKMAARAEYVSGCMVGMTFGTTGGFLPSAPTPVSRAGGIYLVTGAMTDNAKIGFGQIGESTSPDPVWGGLQLTGINPNAPLETLLARLAEPNPCLQIPLPSVTSLGAYGYTGLDFTNPHGVLLAAPTAASGTLPPMPTPGANFDKPTAAVAETRGVPRFPAGEVIYRNIMVIGQEAVAVP